MDEIERRLRQTLDRASGQAGSPAPLGARRTRKIRGLQFLFGGAALALVVILIGGSVWAFSPRLTSSADDALAGATASTDRAYVIDGAPGGVASDGQVLALDPNTGALLARFEIGSDIDAALSPDGDRLYAVGYSWNGDDTRSVLQEFDTSTSERILQVPVPYWQGTTGFHLTNKIAVSGDGSRVLILLDVPSENPDSDGGQALATFDVSAGSMLSDVAPLPACGGGPSILPHGPDGVIVVCREVGEVRFLRIGDSGELLSSDALPLATTGATVTDEGGNVRRVGYVSEAVLSDDEATVFAVTRDGMVFAIDVASHAIVESVKLQLPDGQFVAVPQVRLAPGNHSLLIGVGAYPSSSAIVADLILAFDTGTWNQVDSIEVEPFTALDVSPDGSAVYTINFDSRVMQRMSLPLGEGLSTVEDVAYRPQAIYMAPG